MSKKHPALQSLCAMALLGGILAQSAVAQTVTLTINNFSAKAVMIMPQLTVVSTTGSATLNSGTAVTVGANKSNSDVTVSLSPSATGVAATLQVDGFYDPVWDAAKSKWTGSQFCFIQSFSTTGPGAQIQPDNLNAVRPFNPSSTITQTGSGANIVATIPSDPILLPETKWSIKNKTIVQKDGKNFYSMGVCYSPAPIGSANYAPGCGDWFGYPWWTFNGSNGVNDIGSRDISNLKGIMGVNTIRTYFTYFWWPNPALAYMSGITQTTPASTYTPSGGYPYTVFFDHTNFLDACYKAGIYVILGIPMVGGDCFDFSNPSVSSAYQNYYLQTAKKLAALYGKHPAVMAFCVGNEQNQGTWNLDSRTWVYYQQVYKAIKESAPDKLVTIAFEDDVNLYNGSQYVKDQPGVSTSFNGWPIERAISAVVDVWGINNYGDTGKRLGKFQKNVVNPQKGLYARPLWLTEWGTSTGRNSPKGTWGPPTGTAGAADFDTILGKSSVTKVLNSYYLPMLANLKFCAGGQVFEYCDEWWKNASGLPSVQDGAPKGATHVAEHWGFFGVAVNGRNAVNPDPSRPDLLTPRNTYIKTLKGNYKSLNALYLKQ